MPLDVAVKRRSRHDTKSCSGRVLSANHLTFSFALASAFIIKPIDRLRFIGYLEFVVDFMDMLLNGAGGDAQQVPNLLIEKSFG